MLLELALRSLWQRRSSVLLTLLSLALGVFIVLGVEHIRSQTRASFTRTISGVDLIVGARTSQLNLLLYSVFRIGNATNDIRWSSYEALAADPRVAWAIPLALGDSHRGYRVVGTTSAYFEHFRYGDTELLAFVAGSGFAGTYSVVLGADVARTQHYGLDSELVLSHGLVATRFNEHQQRFRVSGILEPTGTPVDQAVYVTLQGIEALHLDWQGGTPLPGRAAQVPEAEAALLQPAAVTAVLLGLQSRLAVFGLQREINEYDAEPLTAIMPGVALAELWQSMRLVEGVLQLISALVLLASLLGLVTMLLVSLQQRQRELALYRAIGAPAFFILLLLELEALLLATGALVLGSLLLLALQLFGAQWLQSHYGVNLAAVPDARLLMYALVFLGLSAALALLPALGAYRASLQGRLAGSE
jgi:putative ABC transport system permease protein